MRKIIFSVILFTSIFYTSIFASINEYSLNEIQNQLEKSDYTKSDSFKIILDNKELILKDGVLLHKDIAYLPIRELGEKLGFKIDYDKKPKTSIVSNNNITLKVSPNTNNAIIVKNGKENSVDIDGNMQPIILDGTIYVPLRFISNSFGYHTEYNSSTKTISLVKSINTETTTQATTQTAQKISQTTTQNINNNQKYVYITRKSKKYHYINCRYIKGKNDITKMRSSEAKKYYEPCSICMG